MEGLEIFFHRKSRRILGAQRIRLAATSDGTDHAIHRMSTRYRAAHAYAHRSFRRHALLRGNLCLALRDFTMRKLMSIVGIDMGLFASIVVMLLMGRYCYESLGFAMGATNRVIPNSRELVPLVLLAITTSILVVVMLVRCFSKHGNQLLGVRRARFLLLAILAFSIVVIGLFIKPFYVTFTSGFASWTNASVNAGAIRQWRASYVTLELVDRQRWPQSIQQLSPVFVETRPGDVTRLIWGDGFGHWGIDVFPHSANCPAGTPGEYAVPVSGGVCAWHQRQ